MGKNWGLLVQADERCAGLKTERQPWIEAYKYLSVLAIFEWVGTAVGPAVAHEFVSECPFHLQLKTEVPKQDQLMGLSGFFSPA